MLIGARALYKVAEALYQNAAGEHIAERRDVLAVAVGLVEGLGEAVGYQQGEVRVRAAEPGIGVGVAVNGVDALDVLGHDVTVGVHAEGADLVAVLLRTVNELGFIYHVGDVLKDSGGKLDADADVHLVVYELYAQLLALVCKPLGTASAGGGDEIGAAHAVAVFEAEAVSPAVAVDGADLGAEAVFNDLFKVFVHILKYAKIVLGAKMLYLGLQKMQIILQCFALERSRLGSIGGEGFVRRAVLHIYGVDVVYQLHDLFVVHEVGEPAAELGGEVILTV